MKTPEHDKLKAVKEQSQVCGEFLDWLQENGISLCRWQDTVRHSDEIGDYTPRGYYPVTQSAEQLLADFFGVDLAALDQEKREILAELRVGHPRTSIRRELGLEGDRAK